MRITRMFFGQMSSC